MIDPSPAAIEPTTAAIEPTTATRTTIDPSAAAIEPTTATAVSLGPAPFHRMIVPGAAVVPGRRFPGPAPQENASNNRRRPPSKADQKFSPARRNVIGIFFRIRIEIIAHKKPHGF
ncbi:MAG: hypothetical protein RKR03_00410 [Candidatus Competibacter sp.]|nr:hypothetical protein [Candidatus Competibacter sp.]